MATEFKLPELGENIESGRVVTVMVKEGDQLEKDQVVMELETDKAVIEVPSEVSGKIESLNVKEGEDIEVGATILTVSGTADSSSGKKEQKKAEESSPDPDEGKSADNKKSETKKEETAQDKKTGSQKSGSVLNFKVPELGENIESGSVARVLVKSGDTVQKDQGLLELETDKAVVEVPSEVSGTIKEILIKEGDQVDVGQVIMKIESDSEAGTEDEKAEEKSGGEKKASAVKESESAEKTKDEPADTQIVAATSAPQARTVSDSKDPAPAAPSVRRFAREIGIDINQVPGSGPSGRISIEDVKAYSKTLNKKRAAGTAGLPGIQAESLPDFSKWGATDRQPMNKVREKTAQHLSYAWATIPHVTQFDKADITDLEKLRRKYATVAEKAGGKLTVTAILLKVIERAMKKFPQFNASIDMQNNEVIYKKYFNIGIAVDTDRGLLVPVVRDVDQKSIVDLSVELTEISKKARERKLSLEEMNGGNFSISNLGGIGGTAFTPVVNAPEVAILGVSRSVREPVWQEDQFVPRMMLPLSLSYDHRLIDGADAARFLRWVCEALEEPFLLSLEG